MTGVASDLLLLVGWLVGFSSWVVLWVQCFLFRVSLRWSFAGTL